MVAARACSEALSTSPPSMQAYTRTKALEDRVAELSWWGHAARERLAAADKEASALRRKLAEMTQLTDKLTKGACMKLFCLSCTPNTCVGMHCKAYASGCSRHGQSCRVMSGMIELGQKACPSSRTLVCCMQCLACLRSMQAVGCSTSPVRH